MHSYVISVSTKEDGSSTQTEVSGSTSRWTITNLAYASAARVGVAGKANGMLGTWALALVASKGAKAVRVTVMDSQGKPVTGGAITWRMLDDSAWSSRTYGLTDDGVIEFPMAPAGEVRVSIDDARTSDGLSVSADVQLILGFEEPVITVPEVPINRFAVRVIMPNGLPVANANVSVDYGGVPHCVDWTTNGLGDPICNVSDVWTFEKEGFTVATEASLGDKLTDADGWAKFAGFYDKLPDVVVTYDDGVIGQQQKVPLSGPVSTVTLDYMPWVEVAQSSLTADMNATVPVAVSVAEPTYPGLARRSLPQSAKAGVRVTVVPPKGAPKGTCKAQLSGTTNAKGKVTLKICATKSGVYGFKTSGAASVSTFRLFVKGAAPMPVTSVTAKSRQLGSIRATWAAPLFDGRSPIVSYTVTASARGKKTVTKTLKANVKTVTLTGLANATTYTVKITATTKKGTSDPVTVSVPVA